MAVIPVVWAASDVASGNALRTAVQTTAADGDTVTLAGAPAGNFYDIGATEIAVTNKSLRIIGEGKKLAKIKVGAANGFNITNPGVSLDGLLIQDLALVGNGTTSLRGIKFVGSPGKAISYATFRGLAISGMLDGINLDNSASLLGEHNLIEECDVTTCNQIGVWLDGCSMARLRGINANACQLNGLRAINCTNLLVLNCAAQGCNTGNEAPGSTFGGGAQMLIKLSHQFAVQGFDVESMPTAAAAGKVGLVISNCNGGSIHGYNVAAGSSVMVSDTYGIRGIQGTRGIRVGGMQHSWITNPLWHDKTSEEFLYDDATIIRAHPSDAELNRISSRGLSTDQ